jgi:hypothetical protein
MENAKGELVPGGLAMVIGCARDPSNIGKSVTTEFLAEEGHVVDGRVYSGGDGSGWYCTAPGLAVYRQGVGPVVTGYAYIDSSHLMPINPEADPLHTEQEQCMSA